MTAKQIEHFRQLLTQERDNVNRRITDDQERARQTMDGVGDTAEVSVQSVNTDNALKMGELRTSQFNDIEMALGRINRGEYGKCMECGRDIELQRLELIPMATLCITCARKAEPAMVSTI